MPSCTGSACTSSAALPSWQTRAALLKGIIMAGFAIGIAVEVLAKLARGLTPDAGIMGAVALAALGANAAVLAMLWRHIGPTTSTCDRRGSARATT